MKKTYKITLPKGAKVYHTITQPVNGILEVTVNMEQKYVPKDGDIVTSSRGIIAIYAGTNETEGIMTYAALHEQRLQTVVSERGWGCTFEYRPATEAEKQRLFDALAKYGKRWDAEKKCIEDLPRWRAERAAYYFFVNIPKCEVGCIHDYFYAVDNLNYNVGNYFRTREAAEKVASQIRDIFKNSKAE